MSKEEAFGMYMDMYRNYFIDHINADMSSIKNEGMKLIKESREEAEHEEEAILRSDKLMKVKDSATGLCVFVPDLYVLTRIFQEQGKIVQFAPCFNGDEAIWSMYISNDLLKL